MTLNYNFFYESPPHSCGLSYKICTRKGGFAPNLGRIGGGGVHDERGTIGEVTRNVELQLEVDSRNRVSRTNI